MQWFAQAPSNIALIKYMGKKDSSKNIPGNASLSFTLNNLLSNVTLDVQTGKQNYWEPLTLPGAAPFSLSEKAQTRFLNHLAFLKKHFNYSGGFVVRSNNNFPHSSGLASSASSFAALTKCAVAALCELTNTPLISTQEQASLSRMGSGSSCRSFFPDWALWHDNVVEAIELPYNHLMHQVIIISHDEKDVSSSEAHQRINTSPLYRNRNARAKENLKQLLNAFEAKSWEAAFEICWREFQDMHQLFSSSTPSFTYMTFASDHVLYQIQDLWQREGDGPLVTMDAGPNIHLLYREDQVDMAHRFRLDYLAGNYDVL